MTVRSAGALKIGVGGVGFAGVLVFFNWLRRQGWMPTGFGMIPLGLPGAYALMGLLEVVTGVPFTQVARKWDDLAGWQRGVLGLLVVAIAIVVMMGTVVLVG